MHGIVFTKGAPHSCALRRARVRDGHSPWLISKKECSCTNHDHAMRNQIRLHFISFRKAVFFIAERTRRCLLERYIERTSKGCRGLNEWSHGPRGLKNSHLVFNTKMLLVARCSMVTDHLQCHRRHARRVLSLRCRLIGAQRTSQERARGCHHRTDGLFCRRAAHLGMHTGGSLPC